jgi:uncharacterized protein (TIGR00299 family) protein
MTCLAYLDCFSGISGDMFLGALVDAGLPASLLEETARSLGLGAEMKITRVDRSGISATKVDVLVPGAQPPSAAHEHHRHHNHQHDHEHEAQAGAPSPLKHAHGRHLSEIRKIIAAAKISEGAKRTATAVFEALGAAEAKVHNVPVEKIHFHEVGAVDAIVDIVCAAVGAGALGVDEWMCSPLNVGGGTVECAHGTFPVPAPAVVELLKDAPVFSSGLNAELVTPTGAAIVKVLASRFGPLPGMKIEKSGYGAGSRDFKRYANVCRIVIGTSGTPAVETQHAASLQGIEDTVTVLEANLDDMSPEVFAYVMERTLEAGALDVFATPVQMKKGRPGMLLTVLAKPGDTAALTKLIFAETTTLGVRRREEKRAVLARRWEEVGTPWGKVRMKIANLNGAVANFAPEYEDCRRLAGEHHVPLKQVMQEAMAAWSRRAERTTKGAKDTRRA